MHWLDIHDFESWLPQQLVKISYQSFLLVLKVLTFPILHISGALWMATGNVLFQSALVIAVREHSGQVL
jgi:hypothetical protein